MAVPIIRNAMPHHNELPGKIFSKSVTIPDVMSDQPMVVRYFIIINNSP
jgi:hypothetical protein